MGRLYYDKKKESTLSEKKKRQTLVSDRVYNRNQVCIMPDQQRGLVLIV